MTVLSIMVCHFAVVVISLVELPVISSPSAATTEASAKTSSVAAAIFVCIHCSIEVAIGIADVFCDCRNSCLLLGGGNNFFN